MAGVLQKFGANAGSTSQIVLIGPVQLAANNQADITDFGGTGAPGSAGTVVEFQKSNDNFSSNIVPLSRIELPSPGTMLKSFDTPIRVQGGQSIRVIGSQGTAGAFSAELGGQTKDADVLD